jgi:hypothetical protein
VITVWRSPDGEAIRYQCDPEAEIFEVTETDEGETVVGHVPGDWPELTP